MSTPPVVDLEKGHDYNLGYNDGVADVAAKVRSVIDSRRGTDSRIGELRGALLAALGAFRCGNGIRMDRYDDRGSVDV